MNSKIGQWQLLSLDNRKKKKRLDRGEQCLMDLWDTIKQTNIHVVGVPEEEKGAERIFEKLMAENFLSLKKYININIQSMIHVR